MAIITREGIMSFEKKCRKNCFSCDKLNIKTDGNGYPYEHECLRFNDAIDPNIIVFDKKCLSVWEL